MNTEHLHSKHAAIVSVRKLQDKLPFIVLKIYVHENIWLVLLKIILFLFGISTGWMGLECLVLEHLSFSIKEKQTNLRSSIKQPMYFICNIWVHMMCTELIFFFSPSFPLPLFLSPPPSLLFSPHMSYLI